MSQFLTNEKYGDGSDGNYDPVTGTDAPIDSACTGTIATTSLTATNASFTAGQMIMIHQSIGTGGGQWELNNITSYVAGTITLKYALTYGYATGAQVLVVKQYANALIDTGVTLTAKAWNGTVGGIVTWVANGVMTLTGTISADGKGHLAATSDDNSFGDGKTKGFAGNSSFGVGTASNGANGAGGGGGGGDYSPGGAGGGGNGAAGTAGASSTAGNAGATDGNAALTDMTFGGGGGKGGAWPTPQHGGDGGRSGGIVFLMAPTITGAGTITTDGTNGLEGTGVTSSEDNRVGTSGGGGGAGGSILLKGMDVTMTSATLGVAAGSGGPKRAFAGNGGAGGVGRIHADYATSVSGVTSNTQDSTLEQQTFFGGVI